MGQPESRKAKKDVQVHGRSTSYNMFEQLMSPTSDSDYPHGLHPPGCLPPSYYSPFFPQGGVSLKHPGYVQYQNLSTSKPVNCNNMVANLERKSDCILSISNGEIVTPNPQSPRQFQPSSCSNVEQHSPPSNICGLTKLQSFVDKQ